MLIYKWGEILFTSLNEAKKYKQLLMDNKLNVDELCLTPNRFDEVRVFKSAKEAFVYWDFKEV
jgi:hypothetical protein